MFVSLPQFVPQDVCLSCEGCCRFREEKSPWRPKVMPTEAERMETIPGVRGETTCPIEIMDGGYIRALPVCHPLSGGSCNGQFRCAFFSLEDNTCGIYHNRPLECRLYPFLITKRGSEMAVAVHLSCLYVQDKRDTPAFDSYAAQLKTYLHEKDVSQFLETQAGDYAGCEEEIETLFTAGPARPQADNQTGRLLAEKNLIRRYLDFGKYDLSAFSFVSIFAWKDFFDFDLRLIKDNLCIFARHDTGCFLYLPPLGRDVPPQTIEACFALMQETNGGGGVTRIENVGENQLHLFASGAFSHYRKGYEYCYYRKDIADLKGNSYKSKRSSYNQFQKNYSYRYLPYDSSMREACAGLYDGWAEKRRQAYPQEDICKQMLEDNRKVHALVLEYYKELDLVGRVVSVDGRIKAYSFGYPINDEVFCILFEIADLSLKGLSTFIFRELCADEDVQKYKFINVMDDFEMPRLRQTKMSFRPAFLLASHVVTRR
jgi:Fe-S-cluster containining protein